MTTALQKHTDLRIIGFDDEKRQIIHDAYDRYQKAIEDLWHVSSPKVIEIHLLDSWLLSTLFYFSSPLILFGILLGLTLLVVLSLESPILFLVLALFIVELFRFANFQWKNTPAATVAGFFKIKIGVNQKYLEPVDELQSNICHELLHVNTRRLGFRKFFWDEGIATFTEMYFNPTRYTFSPTILASYKKKIGIIQALLINSDEERADYQKSYWIIKYLFENHHDLLLETISRKRGGKQYDKDLARRLNIRGDLRKRLEELAYSHFVLDTMNSPADITNPPKNG